MQTHKLVSLSKILEVYIFSLNELFNGFKLAVDIILLLITFIRVLLVCKLLVFSNGY